MYRSLLLLVILLFLAPAPLQPVRAACNPDAFLRRVSVSSSGEQGNGHSYSGALSANGRMVGFVSNASNLVPNDTNNATDAFIHNLDTCETSMVSINANGDQTIGIQDRVALSEDGHLVVFASTASNLVPGDGNSVSDIFFRDMISNTVQRISVGPGGADSNSASVMSQMTPDGNWIVFSSSATNLQSLVPVPGGLIDQVYVFNRQTGLNEVVSLGIAGQAANGSSFAPDISADGRFVTFTSQATNLVPEDSTSDFDVYRFDRLTRMVELVSQGSGNLEPVTSGEAASISDDGRYIGFFTPSQVFVRDMQTQSISLVSVNFAGEPGDCADFVGSISGNGRYVAFMTCAGNLAPNDIIWTASVYSRDLWTGEIRRVALTWQGERLNNGAGSDAWSAVSARGEAYVFNANEDGIVPEDTNGFADVYVTGLPPASPIIPQRNFYTVQNPVLTWAGTSNAIRYELQVARTAAFTPPLAFQTTVNAPQQEAEVTLIAGQYFWRVRSCTGPTTCGAWSAVDSLVIELP